MKPRKSNYLENIKLDIDIVYPRLDFINTVIGTFADINGIDVSIASRPWLFTTRYGVRKKRARHTNYIKIRVTNDAFKNPNETIAKLFKMLQLIMDSLDTRYESNRDLLMFINTYINNVCDYITQNGVNGYASMLQQHKISINYFEQNETASVGLNIYYSIDGKSKEVK